MESSNLSQLPFFYENDPHQLIDISLTCTLNNTLPHILIAWIYIIYLHPSIVAQDELMQVLQAKQHRTLDQIRSLRITDIN